MSLPFPFNFRRKKLRFSAVGCLSILSLQKQHHFPSAQRSLSSHLHWSSIFIIFYITKLQLCFFARQSLSSHLQKKTLHRSLCLICILQKNTSQHLLFGLMFKKKAILLHSFSFSLIVFLSTKMVKMHRVYFLRGKTAPLAAIKRHNWKPIGYCQTASINIILSIISSVQISLLTTYWFIQKLC